jgi:hypothetical protein
MQHSNDLPNYQQGLLDTGVNGKRDALLICKHIWCTTLIKFEGGLTLVLGGQSNQRDGDWET